MVPSVTEIALEMHNSGCFNPDGTLNLEPLTKLPTSKTINELVELGRALATEYNIDLIATPPQMQRKIGHYLGKKLGEEIHCNVIDILRKGDEYFPDPDKRDILTKSTTCSIVDDYVEGGGYGSGIAEFVRKHGVKCNNIAFIFYTRRAGFIKLQKNNLERAYMTDYGSILHALKRMGKIDPQTAVKWSKYSQNNPL